MTVLLSVWIVACSLATLAATVWRVRSERRLWDALGRLQAGRR